MIQYQLKLKLTKAQERMLEQWLYHLASVWNWAIRKIELDAKDGICAVCGTAHDRDVNAAMNTLIAGVRSTHERVNSWNHLSGIAA